MEALAGDEETAERLAARKKTEAEKKPQPRRRMSDWSVSVELLTSINDRLGDLTQVTAMLGGARPRKVPHGPYPAVAADRVRKRQREADHQSLVARMLPHKASAASKKAA